jgi:uncharacterized protein YheU (UPF0270 family)
MRLKNNSSLENKKETLKNQVLSGQVLTLNAAKEYVDLFLKSK